MCFKATAVDNAIAVEKVVEYQGVTYVYVGIEPADPYGSFKKLPAAIEYRGRTLGRSCFDSDQNVAIYRSDVSVAINAARTCKSGDGFEAHVFVTGRDWCKCGDIKTHCDAH